MTAENQAIIVFGLSNGDEGKGATIDCLTRQTDVHTVVRFNGGAQAAHNVIAPDGRHHTFSSFGSGTFAGAYTHLSRFFCFDPVALVNEAEILQQKGVSYPYTMLTVDPRCKVVTPFHKAVNRLLERLRGTLAHGTCGMGIGECVSDSLRYPEATLYVGDLQNRQLTRAKLLQLYDMNWFKLTGFVGLAYASLRDYFPTRQEIETFADFCYDLATTVLITESEEFLSDRLDDGGTVIFEGAQGVLLDESWGFHPHTTWSNTTPANALTLLSEAGYAGQVTRLGCLRSYATRHGAGPFVSEATAIAYPELHNVSGNTQGSFRTGIFDAVATRYAIEVSGGVDGLAISHLDCRTYPDTTWFSYVNSYEYRDHQGPHAREERERYLGWQHPGTHVRDRYSRIVVYPDIDLDRQQRLGEILDYCQAKLVVGYGASTPLAYAEQLAATVGAPVHLIATGLTARDRVLVDPARYLRQAQHAATVGLGCD